MADERKVEWIDDYDLLKTFYSKKVKVKNKYNLEEVIYIQLLTVKDYFDNDVYPFVLQIFDKPLKKIQETFKWWKIEDYYDYFKLIIFGFAGVKEFISLREDILDFIDKILPSEDNQVSFDMANQIFKINNIIVDKELWDHIWYIIWLSFNPKKASDKKPIKFSSALEESFYRQKIEAEERIQRIKQQNQAKDISKDQMLKIFLVIMYALPQINFEFLFNCTYAEIDWLYEYSMNICNYEVEASALAAGNMKKKIKFFTEK